MWSRPLSFSDLYAKSIHRTKKCACIILKPHPYINHFSYIASSRKSSRKIQNVQIKYLPERKKCLTVAEMRKKSIWIYHITYTRTGHSGQEHTQTQFLPTNDNDDSACRSLHVANIKINYTYFRFAAVHTLYSLFTRQRENAERPLEICGAHLFGQTEHALHAVLCNTQRKFTIFLSPTFPTCIDTVVCANSKLYLRIPTITSHHLD